MKEMETKRSMTHNLNKNNQKNMNEKFRHRDNKDNKDNKHDVKRKTKEDRKSGYQTKRDKEYEHFLRVCDSIPDYMLKKLKTMPNNKGYIWRNVFCYGNLKAEEGQPTIMFEKKNGILVIHEWTNTEYKIWHKEGKENKVLQNSYIIRKKNIHKNI